MDERHPLPHARRDFLKKAITMPIAGAMAMSLEEQALLAAPAADNEMPKEEDAKTEMPMGKIGKLNVSRLICGGNLISGYAHSRDLIYVSELVRKYHTDERILDTFSLCEAQGINTFLSDPRERPMTIINKYWKERGGKMQWIAEGHPRPENWQEEIDQTIDHGASAIYIQGHVSETWLKDGIFPKLGEILEYIRQKGLPAGIGGHYLTVPMACEEHGVQPDFFMKTLHSHRYWSVSHPQERDNVYCRKPDETVAYMKDVEIPWIAYKVLAAGAISPTAGFKFALEGGADFLCVGMFDFQVKDDVKILKGLFARGIERERPWRG